MTPRTVACQAPLSMGYSRQEYQSRLPFSSPGDLPHPGIELRSPALLTDSSPSEPPGNPSVYGSDFSPFLFLTQGLPMFWVPPGAQGMGQRRGDGQPYLTFRCEMGPQDYNSESAWGGVKHQRKLPRCDIRTGPQKRRHSPSG